MTKTPKLSYLLFLSALSGLLFWAGWPTRSFPLILFLAFVPLLKLEEVISLSEMRKKAGKFFACAYLALLIWNVSTTYWVYNSTAAGGIFAMTCNALLMSVPLMLFFYTKKYLGKAIGLIAFIFYWIAFEYIHLNWSLSWPWLTIGNAFASLPQIVQWYEYTGVFGGTLWVLVSNVLFFILLHRIRNRKHLLQAVAGTVVWVMSPLLLSWSIYKDYEDFGIEQEVIVVQPNVDPYNEKFESSPRFIPYELQMRRLIDLSERMITPDTKYVVWPETALPIGYDEENINTYEHFTVLKDFVKKHNGITLVTGLDSYKIYDHRATPTARPIGGGEGFYDSFNAAVQLSDKTEIVFYHKSRLVPGVEFVPEFMSAFVINMGGGAGILGSQKERTVFFNKDSTGIAPVICYESIFGEFVSEYVAGGANFIFIITNDGWWGNTEGHQQHLMYARLRAIETRKCIARSANTGISGFIDQRGNITSQSRYWVQDVMRASIKGNDIKTVYVEYGDYIGRGGLYMSAFLIVFLILGSIARNFVRGQQQTTE